jgi:hypothetical protein
MAAQLQVSSWRQQWRQAAAADPLTKLQSLPQPICQFDLVLVRYQPLNFLSIVAILLQPFP